MTNQPGFDLRRRSCPIGHHSVGFREESKGNRPTLPRSDFGAPSGFLNLSASCSFRCFPNVFQFGRTRGVRSLQRFLLSGCRRCRAYQAIRLPFSRLPARSSNCAAAQSSSFRRVVYQPGTCSRVLDRMIASDCLFRGRLPLMALALLGHRSFFRKSAACFACLQGFELPRIRSAIHYCK